MDVAQLTRLVDELRQLGTDTQRIEVKACSKELSTSVVESVCAFANDGGGLLILGLDERSGFQTVDGFDPVRIQNQLVSVCEGHFDRPLRPIVDILPFDNNSVVVAQISALEPRQKPCYIKRRGGIYGNAYIRTGDGDHRLTQFEIDQMLANHGQPRHDVEPVAEADYDSLDPKLVDAFLSRQRQLHPRLFTGDKTAVLRRLRVIAAEEECQRIGHVAPTLAGLLALGEYPQYFFPQLTVTCTAYAGSTKGDVLAGKRFLDDAHLRGPIPALVEDAVAFVQRNMRTGAVMRGTMRYDLPDYPLDAVREAVTNALMHRDYSPGSQGAQVQVNLYADRLEVQSPGGLFGSVTVDKLGADGVSDSRNQHLAEILEATPYVDGGMVAENRGTGYAIMVHELQRAHMPAPIPVDKIRYFRLTFPRRHLTEAELGASAGRSSRGAITAFLGTVESASVRDLAAVAGITVGSARRVLASLVDEGVVQRTQPLKSPKQRYRLAAHDGVGNLS